MIGKGVQRRVIASVLNLHPDTIAHYADAASIEQLLVTRYRAGKLDRFKDYLDVRWNEGCTDATLLTEELRERGYRGTSRTVRRYLEPIRAMGSPAAHIPAPPKPREVTGWMKRHPDEVSGSKKLRLTAILARCPKLDVLAALVNDFAKMLCRRLGGQLPAWLDAAEAAPLPELHVFAAGPRRDLAAVTNGLTLH